jgi:hypothetical protein
LPPIFFLTFLGLDKNFRTQRNRWKRSQPTENVIFPPIFFSFFSYPPTVSDASRSRNAPEIEQIEREIQEIERSSVHTPYIPPTHFFQSFLIHNSQEISEKTPSDEIDRYKREAKEYLKQIEILNRELFDANEKIMQKELRVAQLEIDGIHSNAHGLIL